MSDVKPDLRAIFCEALDRKSTEELARYLDAACGDDAELRVHVEELLASHGKAGNFLGGSATSFGATVIPEITEESGTVIGPYKLLQKLGEGGMGSVWVAEQSEPVKRRIALKLIKIGMDTTHVLRRFEAERQALALMEHQNIAKVLDAGATPQGRPYFAMELIKGIPISKYCDQEHLTPRERLELFIPVCQAVQHAHQKGVIHRDLKPSNVLIALYDGKPVPKVIDFGVAKATSQKLTERTLYTEVGQIVGTLEYMAPEQAELNNLDIDTRADVYSLGVILYELLAGSPPFTSEQLHGAAFNEMLRMIREDEPPKPSTRLSSSDNLPSIAANRKLEPSRLTRLVHGDLDWIVMKALEKDRARRYETANGFAMDIQRYLADEPVSAGPPGAGYRLRKLVRRNRGPVIASVAVAIALVAGVAAVVVVQARANRELGAKNDELADEQAKVQARFEMAQKAIATFHTGVSEDMLLKNDQFKELRTKLLKEAARFYADLEKLLAGETDAKSRRLLAAGYDQLGDLTEKIGSQPEALSVHRQALAILRELAGSAGADVETRLNVARSLWKVGRLLDATGDKAGALAAWEEQRDLSERLAAEDPSGDVRAVLVRSHHNIGQLLSQTGKPAEALAAYEKALAIRQKLVDTNPTVNELQQDLAWSHNDIGILLSQTGKPAEALASYEKALAIRQKLVDTNPTVTKFQSELALSHNDIGILLSQTGKPAEALAAHEKALAIRQKLADANPAVNNFQSELALSRNSVGLLLTRTGKSAEGLAVQQNALAIQEKLADANPAVIIFQRNLAWTQNVIGSQLAYRSKLTEALATYERALAIYQKLADANPAVTLFQSDAARSHYNIGRTLSQAGKSAEALAAQQKALAIRQKLSDANPAVTDWQSGLAWSHNAIGEVLSQTGKPTEALVAHQKALSIRQRLADANPTVTDFQDDLASSHTTIGDQLSRSGKPTEALASYQKALAIRQKLVDANPAVTQFQRDLAASHLNIGWHFAQAGKNGEAIEHFTREEAIRQKLVAAESAGPSDRDSLANCQTNTADLLRKAGRRVEARAACERALALREPLVKEYAQVTYYRGGLAETYLRTGQLQCDAKNIAAAAASWRRAVALYEGLKVPSGEQTFLRACCHAGLSELGNRAGSGVSTEEGRAETERAMSCLHKAGTAGYGNPDAYRTESALDPLRGRDDFKRLVAELESKAKVMVK